MEYLRYVVRAGDVPDVELVGECSTALRALLDDDAELVPVCLRLVGNQPRSAALVWFAARLLTTLDPRDELAVMANELRGDHTHRVLSEALPADATLAVVGGGELLGTALVRRGDAHVVVIDSMGLGDGLVRRLERADNSVERASAEALGVAVSMADVVVIDAVAVSPDHLLGVPGSRAAAAVAASAGVPVWGVVARCRSMPDRMLQAMLRRLGDDVDTLDGTLETVAMGLVDRVVDHRGVHERLVVVDVPDAAELRG